MSAYQVYEQAIKRRRLYALACCAVLAFAAPSHAAPKARHRAKSRTTRPAVQPPKGSLPNLRTHGVASDYVSYVRPDKKNPASIVISMHLDAYEEIEPGKGSFQKQTPQGGVRVKWHREWVGLDPTKMDEYGQAVDSEFIFFPVYSLTVDSPTATPVRLETQQYALRALHLNGHLVQVEPTLSQMNLGNGYVNFKNDYGTQRFAFTFPGGHNALVLRLSYPRLE